MTFHPPNLLVSNDFSSSRQLWVADPHEQSAFQGLALGYNMRIVIFFFKGKHNIDTSIRIVGSDNCFISEITFAELLYGAAKSNRPEQRQAEVMQFIEDVRMVPISGALDFYATERARLEKEGKQIDDFDLLIGATAVVNNFILVTHNTKHFERLSTIRLVDWTNNMPSITPGTPSIEFDL